MNERRDRRESTPSGALRRLVLRAFPNDADLPGQVLALSIPAAIVSLPLYGGMYALRGEALIAAFHVLALAAILVVHRFWRVRERPDVALQTLCICLFVLIALTVYYEGGLLSTTASWLLLVPNLCVIAGFPRAASFWIAAVVAFLGGLLVLGATDHPFPALHAPQPLYARVTDIVFLMLTVCGFTMITLGARRQAVRQLERRNAELAMARDQALEASRAKAQFLAHMSHEIRTPMNGVLGSTELLAVTTLNAEQRQIVQTLKQSADTLLALMNDVLDFSKIEAGRLTLYDAEFDPRELVEYVASLLAPQAAAKKIEFTCRVAPDVPRTLVGDSLRVRQILTNLCVNAIKFTLKGEVAIEVERLPDAAPGRVKLRCSVEDTGIGIADDQLGLLFRPFAQLETAATQMFGGTGLGLAITHELVTMMNGSIEVHSEQGVGSRFSCLLEFLPGAVQDGFPSVRAPLRAALIEPHPRSRSVLAEQLQMLGVQIANPDGASDARALRAVLGGDAEVVLVAAGSLHELTRLHDPESLRAVGDARGRLIVLADAGTAAEGMVEVRGLRTLYKPVVLPLLARTLDALAGGMAGDEPAAPELRLTGQARILVAEDNPVNQRVVTAMLERLGHAVAVAEDGAEALSEWMDGEFDAVIMDCQMPTMDGFQCTRLIRAREAESNRPRTPIIAVTANALSGDRQQCLAAGMDDYIPKPLTLVKLQQALLRTLVDRRSPLSGDG